MAAVKRSLAEAQAATTERVTKRRKVAVDRLQRSLLLAAARSKPSQRLSRPP
jgi:hypothetical protein